MKTLIAPTLVMLGAGLMHQDNRRFHRISRPSVSILRTSLDSDQRNSKKASLSGHGSGFHFVCLEEQYRKVVCRKSWFFVTAIA